MKREISTLTLLENWKKKLWNMKVTIIPIVIGAFGTLTKGLLKGLEDLEVGGRVETIQTTALLKTARILRRVLETWGDLLSLNLQRKTISLRWVINNNNSTHRHNLHAMTSPYVHKSGVTAHAMMCPYVDNQMLDSPPSPQVVFFFGNSVCFITEYLHEQLHKFDMALRTGFLSPEDWKRFIAEAGISTD